MYLCVCVYVCVCKFEREQEIIQEMVERGEGRGYWYIYNLISKYKKVLNKAAINLKL